MYTITDQIEWTQAQSCGDCGTDAAFIRASNGAAICRECDHEHDMDRTQLGEGESFAWVGGDHGDWPAVLFVTCYAVTEV